MKTMTKEEMFADRLALIKERYYLLRPSSDKNSTEEEIKMAVEKERRKKEKHNRLPFITGLGCPNHTRNRVVASVIPSSQWLDEQAARHGFDPDHLVGKTMDELLDLFEKVPEFDHKNFGGISDGYLPDEYSNHYNSISRREAKQTSGTHDIGDGC